MIVIMMMIISIMNDYDDYDLIMIWCSTELIMIVKEDDGVGDETDHDDDIDNDNEDNGEDEDDCEDVDNVDDEDDNDKEVKG